MSLAPLIAKFQEKMKNHPEFKATVVFDLGKDGSIFVDSTQRPGIVNEGTGEAVLTLTLTRELLAGFLDGSKDPNVAYLTGKLKIRGPLGLAMKLNALLED